MCETVAIESMKAAVMEDTFSAYPGNANQLDDGWMLYSHNFLQVLAAKLSSHKRKDEHTFLTYPRKN